ncbi:MAG TPA: sulfurtransferase-like selenium metabolism protein YedF [Dehalococcoidales bacterium]|nr:sulfurtransferase-like selenium metabolism protein YedF [Dehalococcoidales bacterium]
MFKCILIQSEGLGRGDDTLGKLLMASFLRLLAETEEGLDRIIFWNSGVKLVCEGSPVLEHVKKLEGIGIEVLACTTCLEYFELTDKLAVGKPTSMVKSIASMLGEDFIAL